LETLKGMKRREEQPMANKLTRDGKKQSELKNVRFRQFLDEWIENEMEMRGEKEEKGEMEWMKRKMKNIEGYQKTDCENSVGQTN
jgi:hypothetical protein